MAFDLAATVVEHARLHAGDLLTGEMQERLVAQDAPYRAREKALGLLAVRERARREVELRLQAAGFDPEVISDCVAWLLHLDYLNDERFAVRYFAEKLQVGWGDQRIRAELLRKGVERAVVETVLDAAREDSRAEADGMEAVLALARRRFARQFAGDPKTAERRLAGFLARRGYDWDAVRAVARVLRSEACDGENHDGGTCGGGDVQP